MKYFFKFIFIKYHLIKCRLKYILFGISAIEYLIPSLHPILIIPTLKLFNAKIGNNTVIRSGLRITNSYGSSDSKNDFSNLQIGHNCFISYNTVFDLTDQIEIQDNVVLAMDCKLISHLDTGNRISNPQLNAIKKPIKIQNNVYIGASATILYGVTIGENAIIGSCSLVNKDIKMNTTNYGIPVREVSKA